MVCTQNDYYQSNTKNIVDNLVIWNCFKLIMGKYQNFAHQMYGSYIELALKKIWKFARFELLISLSQTIFESRAPGSNPDCVIDTHVVLCICPAAIGLSLAQY